MPINDIRMCILIAITIVVFHTFLITHTSFPDCTQLSIAFSFVWREPENQDRLPHTSFQSLYSFYCLCTQERTAELCKVKGLFALVVGIVVDIMF